MDDRSEEDFVRFPFKFELGAMLPASVIYAGPKDSLVKIQYNLKAILVPLQEACMECLESS